MSKVIDLVFDRIVGDYGSGPLSTMEVNGLKMQLHNPPAPKSKSGEEGLEICQSLPPYRCRPAFPVHLFPHCPPEWAGTQGIKGSWFVPVKMGSAAWLNFNPNIEFSRHLAIVVSVQGICAFTGRPTDLSHLEQYLENCPVHNKAFGPERYCADCKANWPKQNYMATRAQPEGLWWMDGFRAAVDVVRNFYFTEDTAKGIAFQLIGDKRDFAIQIAMFKCKREKPKRESRRYRSVGFVAAAAAAASPEESEGDELLCNSIDIAEGLMPLSASPVRGSAVPLRRMHKKIEVGGGAKIKQKIFDDSGPVTDYEDEASAHFVINYTSFAQALEILAAGETELEVKTDGLFGGLTVGKT